MMHKAEVGYSLLYIMPLTHKIMIRNITKYEIDSCLCNWPERAIIEATGRTRGCTRA